MIAGTRHAEISLATTLCDATVSLTGTIDLLVRAPDRELVVDWKTGWAGDLPPIEEHWQMHAYAWLAHQAGRRPVTVYRVQTDQQRVDRLRFPEDVTWEACRDLLEAIAERVLEGQRETGPHCDRCPVRMSCPEHLSKATTMAMVLAPAPNRQLTTDAQAVALFAALGPVADALEWAREALRQYVAARGGVVQCNGHRVLLRTFEADEIVDHTEAIGACARYGRWPDVTTSKRALIEAAGEDAKHLLEHLRASGAIRRVERSRIEWGK